MGKKESLATFLERMEPEEKSRRDLLRDLAERVHLVRAYDFTKDRFDDGWNDAGGEYICRTDDFATVGDLKAVVVRDARKATFETPPYFLLKEIADHLVDVMEGLADPDWGLIQPVYIDGNAIGAWEAAAKQRRAGNADALSAAAAPMQPAQPRGHAEETATRKKNDPKGEELVTAAAAGSIRRVRRSYVSCFKRGDALRYELASIMDKMAAEGKDPRNIPSVIAHIKPSSRDGGVIVSIDEISMIYKKKPPKEEQGEITMKTLHERIAGILTAAEEWQSE